MQSCALMSFLGTNLCETRDVGSELARRIGQAKAAFRVLRSVWSRCSLGRKQKLRTFEALIQSKLLYFLQCCSFNQAQTRRVNGFQARCLQMILGVALSFLSRVSNGAVSGRAGALKVSEVLCNQQLAYLWKRLRLPIQSPLVASSFILGTLQLATERYLRRRGRPRKELIKEALYTAHGRTGGCDLGTLAENPVLWKKTTSTAHSR